MSLEAPYGCKCKIFGSKILLLTNSIYNFHSFGVLDAIVTPPPFLSKIPWYMINTMVHTNSKNTTMNILGIILWVFTIHQPPLYNIVGPRNKWWYLFYILLILHKWTYYLVELLLLFLYTPIFSPDSWSFGCSDHPKINSIHLQETIAC